LRLVPHTKRRVERARPHQGIEHDLEATNTVLMGFLPCDLLVFLSSYSKEGTCKEFNQQGFGAVTVVEPFVPWCPK